MRHIHGRAITKFAALSFRATTDIAAARIAARSVAWPFRTTGGFNLAERSSRLKQQSSSDPQWR